MTRATSVVAAALLTAAALALLVGPARSAALERRAGAAMGPARWRRGWPTGRPALLLVAAAGAAAGSPAGPVAAALGATAATLGRHRWRRGREAAERGRRRSAEVEVLAALSAELRAGRQSGPALAAAQAVAAPALALALTSARSAAAGGGDVALALRQEPDDGGGLTQLAAAWQVSLGTGAPLAEVVSRVEAELRAVSTLQLKADVELAGARATGGLLASLPALGVILGQAMGAHPLHILLHTRVGAACTACGLVLELAGMAWVARLTGAAVRR